MPERDPMTFEDRLSDAFAAYTAAAPLDVDPHALAAELMGSGRGRGLALPTFRRTRIGSVRLALVLGLLALASVAGFLIAGGFVRSDPAPLGAKGRIQVCVGGSRHLLRDGVEAVPYLPLVDGASCPVLIATADAVGVRQRNVGMSFTAADNRTQSQWFRFGNMERWSSDQSAYAVVTFDNGASVFTFPAGDFVNPTITEYSITGAKDALLSSDGSRLAVAVAAGPESTAIHVLEGGTDTIVAIVPSADVAVSLGSWSPDAEKLIIPTTGAVTGPRLTSIDLRDGSVVHLGRPDGLAAQASLVPLAWSANGWYLVVGSDSGAAWVLDVGRVEWQPLLVPIEIGDPSTIRWSPDGRVAIVNGGSLTVHSFDGTPERRVRLPGSIAAWSPDGRSIASIAEGGDGEVVVWVTDAWGKGESRKITALRDVKPRDITNLNDQEIQWQQEVQP